MMDWSISDIVDAVLAPTSIAFLVAYHAFLCYKVRTSPLDTVMGINRKARRLWVYDMLIENHKKNVLAVQTLRNSIMESTLMATTAVLLTAGLATYFTFAATLKELPTVSAAITGRSSQPIAGTVKSFAVIACFMASFVCHTQSIRFINHVNYMVNVPMSASLPRNGVDGIDGPFLTAEYVADLLERGTVLYTLGSRSFYMAFPLLLWVFGSVAMFVSSILLLHALYNSDFVNSPPQPTTKSLHNHDHDLVLHVDP